jgi:hypothetical protein
VRDQRTEQAAAADRPRDGRLREVSGFFRVSRPLSFIVRPQGHATQEGVEAVIGGARWFTPRSVSGELGHRAGTGRTALNNTRAMP